MAKTIDFGERIVDAVFRAAGGMLSRREPRCPALEAQIQATELSCSLHLTGRSSLMSEFEKKQRSQVISVGQYVLSDLVFGLSLPQLTKAADDGQDDWRKVRKTSTY